MEAALSEPDKLKPIESGRVNAFKQIGDRYIKITYKELSEEILIISAVDKKD